MKNLDPATARTRALHLAAAAAATVAVIGGTGLILTETASASQATKPTTISATKHHRTATGTTPTKAAPSNTASRPAISNSHGS